MLANQWTVPDFYPIGYLPTGVRLTAYSGDAADLPAEVLQRFLDRIAAGELALGPVHVYPLEQVRAAHRDLEEGRRVGKLVLRTQSPGSAAPAGSAR
jgi:NADPH:quinone reductase-like Zn-dependent oxidoreductase